MRTRWSLAAFTFGVLALTWSAPACLAVFVTEKGRRLTTPVQ